LIFNFNNFPHNPRTHILYHRLWYFIQIAFETDVGKYILFAVNTENFSAQSTNSEQARNQRGRNRAIAPTRNFHKRMYLLGAPASYII